MKVCLFSCHYHSSSSGQSLLFFYLCVPTEPRVSFFRFVSCFWVVMKEGTRKKGPDGGCSPTNLSHFALFGGRGGSRGGGIFFLGFC
jgi:hypothetical protein